jgi:ABC-type phosphate transport system substrate-binding protein
MFVGVNKASPADPDFNSTDDGNISKLSELAVVFGTPVTNDLGITNLSRAQITSIMTGNYSDWSQVDPTKSGPITICRRGPGSGSQAANNAWFMHFPCGLSTGSALSPLRAVDDPAHVIENASSGAVLSCLNTHSKAIGVLGTETQPGGGDLWKFVSIDGQAATVQNAATGKYDFYVEQTIQWRNKTVNGAPVPDADQQHVLDTIALRSGDPTFLGSGAVSGVAALWTNGYSPTIPFNAAQPVMQGTRFTNTCTPTTLQY